MINISEWIVTGFMFCLLCPLFPCIYHNDPGQENPQVYSGKIRENFQNAFLAFKSAKDEL